MSDRQFITWQTVEGETTVLSGYKVTPQSQALTLHLPFAGFVWNRPVAVTVEADGVTQQIPIVDATRVTQFTIYGVAALFALFLGRVLFRKAD